MTEYMYEFRRGYKPPSVTNKLVIATVAISMFDLFFAPALFGTRLSTWFALSAPQVWSGEYWRMLTVMLVHGDPLHLGMNMIAFWSLGTLIERQLSWKYLVAVYLVSGLMGSALVLMFDSYVITSVGASGGVFGLFTFLAGWMISQPGGAQRLLHTPMGRALLMPLVLNIAISFLPGISFWGHAGGAVTGLAAGVVLEQLRNKRNVNRAQIAATVVIVLMLTCLITAVRPVYRPEFALNRAADHLGVQLNRVFFYEWSGDPAESYFPWRSSRNTVREHSTVHFVQGVSKEEVASALRILEHTPHSNLDEALDAAWDELFALATNSQLLINVIADLAEQGTQATPEEVIEYAHQRKPASEEAGLNKPDTSSEESPAQADDDSRSSESE